MEWKNGLELFEAESERRKLNLNLTELEGALIARRIIFMKVRYSMAGPSPPISRHHWLTFSTEFMKKVILLFLKVQVTVCASSSSLKKFPIY